MTSTRRIIAFNHVSADGYFASPDGMLNWTVPDEEIEKTATDPAGGLDTILFGRVTYQMFESFWPHALDDEDPTTAKDPHSPGRKSAEMRAMATMINEAKKVVFSRTLKNVTWKNSRIVPELTAAEVEAIKREPGKDIMIFGSGSIASKLTELGLIDEYQFVTSPVLLGKGRPLISGVDKRVRLNLIDAKAHRSGNVMARYAVGNRD